MKEGKGRRRRMALTHSPSLSRALPSFLHAAAGNTDDDDDDSCELRATKEGEKSRGRSRLAEEHPPNVTPAFHAEGSGPARTSGAIRFEEDLGAFFADSFD